jgi:nucleoside 2-deoxyribosyltransferase
MKVHFITSRNSLEHDVDTLHMIMKSIKASGHSLASDWIDTALERLHTDKSEANWREIYRTNLENIAEADVVIAEVSYENFGVGYQVAAAVQQKKPVLLLRHDGADKDAFVTGVEDGWVKYEDYGVRNIEDIMKSFLMENDITTKDMRFNFFIDRPIYNYLRWSALKTGKTKAEILRELVMHEINNKENL